MFVSEVSLWGTAEVADAAAGTVTLLIPKR